MGRAFEYRKASNLEAIVLQVLLNLTETCWLTIDSDLVLFLILIEFVLNAIVNQIEESTLPYLSRPSFKSEDRLMIKKEAKRTLCAKVTIELIED